MTDLFSRVMNGVKILDIHWRGRNTKAGYTSTASSYGLRQLMRESLRYFDIVTPSQVGSYDDVYVSLTSVSDVIELISAFKNRPTPKLHIGGSGCVNIKSIINLISSASFGRCEGIFDNIISGESLSNVWRAKVDPKLEHHYELRQPQYLLEGEQSVGCKYKCKFCQYTYVRNLLGETYTHGSNLKTPEDNMLDMIIDSPGHHTTALDGLSQETRFKVSKPITDKYLSDFIGRAIRNNFNKTTSIKIFMIIGYPWESRSSVLADIRLLQEILYDVSTSNTGGRVFIQILVTPFSPEPLTPMACEPANVYEYWRDVLYEGVGANLIDAPNLNCYILPQVNSPLTLLKRVCVNRGVDADIIYKLSKEKKPPDVKWPEYMSGLIRSYSLANIVNEIESDSVSDYLHIEETKNE